MLDYSMKYRAVRKMLDDVLSTLDRTSDFMKLYELSNRVKAKLELLDDMDRMDDDCKPASQQTGHPHGLPAEVPPPRERRRVPIPVVERGITGEHGETLDVIVTRGVRTSQPMEHEK